MLRNSSQLSSFLRFVVEQTLSGSSDRIKGYTIGVEALGRSANFDPQSDPIVRVEATRLRRAMVRYYAGPGADDPVEIRLTRGSYVPAFSYRNRAAPVAPAAPEALPTRPANGMPVLLVEAFDAPAALPLYDKMCDAFARFDTINIVGNREAAVRPEADYRLIGAVECRDDGTASARFRLIDGHDETVVWARVFERLIAKGGREAAESAVVTELAATLVQPFGVIRAHDYMRHRNSDAGDPRYRAIVAASEAFRSFDPEQHQEARERLERLTAEDPTFASGFAYLAALYFRDYQYGLEPPERDFDTLDRALQFARKAIELKPEISRGYQMLFGVLFARREIAAAFAAGDKARALNPYDTTVIADYGGRLVVLGEIDRGMALLQDAAQFGTVRPSWHHFYLFLGSYLRGDLTNTMHHANQITADSYPLGPIARALAAGMAGDRRRAQQAIARLSVISPAWSADTRGQLARLFPVEALADRLARELERLTTGTVRPKVPLPPA